MSKTKEAEGSSAQDLKTQLSQLAAKQKKSGVSFRDVGIKVSETKQIALPDGMSADEGIKHLQRWQKQQEQMVNVMIEIDTFPLDGAYALACVMKDIFGWTELVPIPGFWSDTPPAQVQFACGPHETVEVPWGRMQVPGVNGWIQTAWGQKGVHPTFRIIGQVQRQHEKLIAGLGDQVRLRVLEQSVYRGKAIVVNYRNDDGERIPTDMENFDPTRTPQFIDTDKVRPEELTFPADTMRMVENCLFSPVRYTEACRQHKIPLKRGVMLEGPYGTGKSLTAYVLAKLCVEHGWTYIYIKDVRDLDIALGIAQMYQPAVVFAEDVNAAVGQNRDDDVNRILNTLDGVGSKHAEIMVVLTTNEVDEIHQAMIRPGRIDTVVPVRAPDVEAAVRLVQLYSRNSLQCTTEEIEQAVLPLVERKATAAVFREVIERARLAALANMADPHDPIVIEGSHLKAAGESMTAHLKLLEPRDSKTPTPMQLFGTAVGRALGQNLEHAMEHAAFLFRDFNDDTDLDPHKVARNLRIQTTAVND